MILRTKESSEWSAYRDRLLSIMPPKEATAFALWFDTFLLYQQQWLLEPAQQSLCNKSRQIGLSHTTAALAVLWAVAFAELTTIISIGQLEACEVLSKAKAHARALRRMGSAWAAIGSKDSAQELCFVNGGRILALPSTGGHGFTGNVFLDEFARHENPSKVWDAAAAVTMHGFRLRVVSTPNGVGNAFHGLCTQPKQNKGWAFHEIPVERAIEDGMTVDMVKLWSLAHGDPRVFDQLFRCKFLDGALQYIPSAAIDACSTDDLDSAPGYGYAGLDIGRTADLTALVIGKQTADGMVRVVEIQTRKRTDQEALDSLVAYAFRTCKVRRLCVDASGLGAFPAEQMQKRWGASKVEPVTFSAPVKEDLATTLHSYFLEEQVRIPRTDAGLFAPEPGSAAALRTDIAAIRREVTSAGNVRYDAPHTDDGHADRAWALALMLHAIGRLPTSRGTVDPEARFQ